MLTELSRFGVTGFQTSVEIINDMKHIQELLLQDENFYDFGPIPYQELVEAFMNSFQNESNAMTQLKLNQKEKV